MRSISRMGWLVAATLPAMILGACSTSHVPEMNTVNMNGDDFNRHLARNYKDFSNFEAYEMADWSDAVVYADKSMAAASGKRFEPDNLESRYIKGDDKVAELQNARGRLMRALNAGAAETVPENAARAQADFDCWAEQQEEGWQFDHIAACKNGFEVAMLATETAMAPVMPVPPMAQNAPPSPAESPEIRPYPHLVFFDWDASELSAEARTTLDQVIRTIRETQQDVRLVGHADSSGPGPYNMILSQNRAEAVRSHLIANGVAYNIIETDWVGENDPRMMTGNGVREQENRWVAIDFVTRVSSR